MTTTKKLSCGCTNTHYCEIHAIEHCNGLLEPGSILEMPVGMHPDEFLKSQLKPTNLGMKFDSHKLRWSLFPQGTLNQILEILEFGAKKYAPDNWKKVDNGRTRYYDALMRHMDAWWQGEKTDPESGKSHLAHAGCCLLFLMFLDKKETTDE